MSKSLYHALFNFLDSHSIKYSLDSNIVRFKDYNFSFFLVLENEDNTYINFIKKRELEDSDFSSFLIFIWFDLWYSKQEIILSKITHLFGLSKKLHARKTNVELVNKIDAQNFFTQNHLNQPVIGYKRIGLSINNELVALASFAKRRKFRDDSYSAELLQFATKNNHHINGGLSKVIKHFIKNHPIDSLMTYIDLDWSTGAKFEKIGFEIDTKRNHVNFMIDHTNGQRTVIQDDNSKIFNTGSLKSLIYY
jgi:hypothetical protein